MLAKRLTLSLLAIGVISLVITAASFALFTDKTTNSTNTFTAGTVKLGPPTPILVEFANIAPGDSGTSTYTVQYIGSLDAYLGLSTTYSGDLATCDSSKFQVAITGHGKTFSNNTADQFIKKFVTNETATLTVAWDLPLAAGNDCQGDAAKLTMMVKAVQAKNNDNGSGEPISW